MWFADRFSAAGVRLRRRRRHGLEKTLHSSWPALASVALKPGQKTWLVARAVSLRAF